MHNIHQLEAESLELKSKILDFEKELSELTSKEKQLTDRLFAIQSRKEELKYTRFGQNYGIIVDSQLKLKNIEMLLNDLKSNPVFVVLKTGLVSDKTIVSKVTPRRLYYRNLGDSRESYISITNPTHNFDNINIKKTLENWNNKHDITTK